jgi:hypothetical protein
MIVELAAEVFDSPTVDLLDLAALVWLCRGDPHALVLDPPFSPEKPPPGLDRFGEAKDVIALILEYGPESAAQRPRTCSRIRVRAGGPSIFQGPVPRLTVFDATRLLSRPLVVLVENRRNDGAFLRKVLPPERRREFERYERDGFVRIDSEGGLGEMRRRVQRLAGVPEEAARVCLVFDRDCRDVDAGNPPSPRPSMEAQDLAQRCAAVQEPWPLRHHMLQRRAIENYLPAAALFGWAGADSGRRDVVEAFNALTTNQRWCFPMKHGLLGDVPKKAERESLEQAKARLEDRHLAPLFHPLVGPNRERLRHGFGGDIAGLFHDQEGVARVHDADIEPAERIAIVSLIEERV